MQNYFVEPMQRNILLIIILSCCFFYSSCRREEHPVPYVPVDVTLYVSDPQFMPINAIGGSTYYPGGSRGLVIYRRSQEDFITYDRHCPFQPENPCGRLMFDSTASFTLIDTCCGSKFLITDGTVQQGPAHNMLRQYRTEYDGIKIHIYN
jgi:nitrite reductase/ring-hydroxylating ferredoxin subunit